MKRCILSITIILTILLTFTGCTFFLVKDSYTLQDDKETFAVDEAKGEDVKKTDDTETVADESEKASDKTPLRHEGPHEFTVEADEGEVLAPDGEVLANFRYSYPVFVCNEGDNAEYVATINKMFKENALGVANEAQQDYDILLEEYNFFEDGWRRPPNDYAYDFEIHIDAKGIISVTEIKYYYSGGAHGNHVMTSHNFDVVEGKKLQLSDLLYGTDEEITAAFTKAFSELEDVSFLFFDDPMEIVPKEFPTAQYYVDTEGVTAYFREYQVGSYAAGFVSATISDKEMLKFDFS